MKNPERFTIIISSNENPETVLHKVKGILRDMNLDETLYRIYMEGDVKAVINIVIESDFSEEFILQALNNQIKFVPTNDRIRRIITLVSSDIDSDEDKEQQSFVNKELEKEAEEEITELVEENMYQLDSSSVKFAEMLQSDEPEKIIDEAENLIEYGEDIQRRAKDVLVTTVDGEIKKAVKWTLNNPRNLHKSMKVLTDLMTSDFLRNGGFIELSQQAGFSAIRILEKNNKYSDDLLKILENEKIDDFVRIKSVLAYVKNMQKKSYTIQEIKEKININVIKNVFSTTEKFLENNEKNLINRLIL